MRLERKLFGVFGNRRNAHPGFSLEEYINGPALPWTIDGGLLPGSQRTDLDRKVNPVVDKIEEDKPHVPARQGPDYNQ